VIGKENGHGHHESTLLAARIRWVGDIRSTGTSLYRQRRDGDRVDLVGAGLQAVGYLIATLDCLVDHYGLRDKQQKARGARPGPSRRKRPTAIVHAARSAAQPSHEARPTHIIAYHMTGHGVHCLRSGGR